MRPSPSFIDTARPTSAVALARRVLRAGLALVAFSVPRAALEALPTPTSEVPAASALVAVPQSAQPAAADSSARVTVLVLHDGEPVAGAIVRALDLVPPVGAQTTDDGRAILRLPAGAHRVAVSRLGLRPDTLALTLRAGQDTTVRVVLDEDEATLEAVVVASTRGERRVEDTPLRVEVIDEEEIAEKIAMTPGDIAMMLNETSGLRVQPTNPSLGGANVRIQGLRGRYAMILADGLPLYGGQTGGLGLLQIPPVDLGRVEIIKGAASALYGSTALGGVINLLSRRPGAEAERTVLLNQTSRGGTDAVFFGGGPLRSRAGWTLLAGAHTQRRDDLDRDGWTDLPGYDRAVVRPRLFFDDGAGRSAFLTGGYTRETRRGGTVDGAVVPGGGAWEESLRTDRADVGGLARWLVRREGALDGAVLTVRGSAMEQQHAHRFGPVPESDRHRTWFTEAALAVPRVYGARAVTYLVGTAFQREAYRAADVSGMDYTFTVPAAFAQVDVDAAPWLAISTSARVDAHDVFGTFVNPRLSVLLRRLDGRFAGWTTRLSAGTGAFAPTPFTDETETTGLAPLVLPTNGGLSELSAERARSASLDIGGTTATALGQVELNATGFASHVNDPLQVRLAGGSTATGAARIALVNAPAPTRTWGGELLVRLVRPLGGGAHDDGPHARHEAEGEDEEHADAHDDAHDAEPPMLRITASYTHLRSTECDPDVEAVACRRREVPLTPRDALGVVASVEQHGRSRIGLELYYTGRQALADNPFRTQSRPYLVVGLLGERAIRTRAGVARVFVNLENLTNVRQTRFDPLRLPARGPGGRWTTDAWTDLVGFTVNGGVRFSF